MVRNIIIINWLINPVTNMDVHPYVFLYIYCNTYRILDQKSSVRWRKPLKVKNKTADKFRKHHFTDGQPLKPPYHHDIQNLLHDVCATALNKLNKNKLFIFCINSKSRGRISLAVGGVMLTAGLDYKNRSWCCL